MKSSNLAVIISTAALMLASAANAEDTYRKSVHNQNLSKRPYHQPLPDSAYQKSNEFEGATLVRGELSEEQIAVNKNQHVMRMNQLSKRPY